MFWGQICLNSPNCSEDEIKDEIFLELLAQINYICDGVCLTSIFLINIQWEFSVLASKSKYVIHVRYVLP